MNRLSVERSFNVESSNFETTCVVRGEGEMADLTRALDWVERLLAPSKAGLNRYSAL